MVISDGMMCPCGCGMLLVREELIVALSELQDLVPSEIVYHSTFRCTPHNVHVGGHHASYHLHGLAADLHITGVDLAGMYQIVSEVAAFRDGGIGCYADWTVPGVHVDVRDWHARWGHYDGEYAMGLVGLTTAIARTER